PQGRAAEAQFGAKGERKKASLEFRSYKTGVLRRGILRGTGRCRLLIRCGEDGPHRADQLHADRYQTRHWGLQVSRFWRTRPSCATEATSVPSRLNISPRA